MYNITNPKIGFKRFRGFSLLFDNPGKINLSPLGSGKYFKIIDCNVFKDTNLKFYAKLNSGIEKINLARVPYKNLIFNLPAYSYHVTVWDGLNDFNKKNVHLRDQPLLEDFLLNLPNSFMQNESFITPALSSPLVKDMWDISFKFSKLTVFSKSTLVALIIPEDEKSMKQFKRVVYLRKILYEKYKNIFGLNDWIENYCPHVSLTYLGNEKISNAIESELDNWTNIFLDQMSNLTIRFNKISLYGFLDMETFFKL